MLERWLCRRDRGIASSLSLIPTLSLRTPHFPSPLREKDRELAGTVLCFCLMVSVTKLLEHVRRFFCKLKHAPLQVGLNSGAQIGDALNAIWFSKEATC